MKLDTSFIDALKDTKEIIRTENGANAYATTGSKLYDLFALGGAYRSRSENDCITLFSNAYNENTSYAMRCLTYLRDIEGQGERRFFRVCLQWLAINHPEAVTRNMQTWVYDGYIRWDDLFVLFDTPVERDMIALVEKQLTQDINNYKSDQAAAISLLPKWLPSSNCSSADTIALAKKFMAAFELTERQYRKMLSALRERIKVTERLMSQNRWEEIDFSHLPSRAGLLYRNAFQKHDCIKNKYEAFAKSDAAVNAKVLYPYDCVKAAEAAMTHGTEIERLMVNKYWDNLTDYFKDAKSDMMVVCDTSGSMTSTYGTSIRPIDIAVSLAMYAAEHAHGPFANHYISFSRKARLVQVQGADFCEKVSNIIRTNLCEDTNLESVFDLVLHTAQQHNLPQSALPSTLVIITDMEVNDCSEDFYEYRSDTLFMEAMRKRWADSGYKLPKLVFWNVCARNNTFLDDPRSDVTYVSGASPVLFKRVLTGISGEELMYQTLNDSRYSAII